MTPAKRRKIFSALRAANPAPRTELIYGSPFQLLVAVVLSAQATDKSVNAAPAGLFAAAPTAAALLKLGLAGLKSHIRTILVAQYGGEVPADREALEALPGVGRKTANVILNCAFGQPTIAVDTHIFRVANRIGLASGQSPRAIEDALVATTPPEFLHDAHHWLILLGRYLCKARRPLCPSCPIERWCEYPDKTRA